MTTFTKFVLYTDRDGRAKFREEQMPLDEGTPQTMLSAIFPRPATNCATVPSAFAASSTARRSRSGSSSSPEKWRSIGLQDGSSRVLEPGDHCYAADVLPPGATFDPKVHGHWSAQRGANALVTLFVRD